MSNILNRIVIVFVVLGAITVSLPLNIFAQPDRKIYLKTITGNFNLVSARMLDTSFNSIGGYGGGIEARIAFDQNFSLGLEAAMNYFSIRQTDAVSNWNWIYWKTYYRSYVTTVWLVDSVYFRGAKRRTSYLTNDELTSGDPMVRKDSIYEAKLKANQYMNVTTFGVVFNMEFPITEMITLHAGEGFHVHLYERNLYLDEEWTKRRVADIGPDSGTVVAFQYGFRNSAPKKAGEAYGISLRGGVDVQLTQLIGIRFSGQYHAIIRSLNETVVRNFPMQSYLNWNAGIVVRY